MIILGIETSCDETAAAVLQDGRVLSNVVASQIAVHSEYGGIVPELASRHHLEAIEPVVHAAIYESGVRSQDIQAVAVTQGPGLIGSLVVGFSFAKAFAMAREIAFTGVNHIHAHLMSIFLKEDTPSFPFIGLIVSGGHTSLYLVRDFLSMELLGHTRDDAAGEAFDKVAKILGFPYPGGPMIGELAEQGNETAFAYPRPYMSNAPLDFSFSGLKTAVMLSVRELEARGCTIPVADIAASFQKAVVDVLVERTIMAARMYNVLNIVLCGGVAANKRLRTAMENAACVNSMRLFLPSIGFCTDNAAMVAVAGMHQIEAGMTTSLEADVFSKLYN